MQQDYLRNFTRPETVQHRYFQALDHFFGRKRAFEWTRSQRTKYYDKIYHELKKRGKGKQKEIDRVKNISLSDFKTKYLYSNIPVILEGAAKNWNCVKEWGLDYFIQKHGTDKITVVGEIEMTDNKDFIRSNYQSTLEKELTDIKNGGSNYYKFYPLMYWHPEHLDDVDRRFLRMHSDPIVMFKGYQVFIGANKTFTNMHNSCVSNLFIQCVGEKEWMLYPAYYTPVIDPSPTDGMSRGAPVRTKAGPFDPFNPSFEYPYHLFEYIDSYHMILQPGDVFYNPPYYWHAVKNNSVSIGMGYRWVSPGAIMRSNDFYFSLDMLSKFWFASMVAYRDINNLHKNFEKEQKKK